MPELITIAEAAEQLGIASSSVRRLIERGVLLPYRPTPRRVVLNSAAVEAYLQSTQDVGMVQVKQPPVPKRGRKYL